MILYAYLYTKSLNFVFSNKKSGYFNLRFSGSKSENIQDTQIRLKKFRNNFTPKCLQEFYFVAFRPDYHEHYEDSKIVYQLLGSQVSSPVLKIKLVGLLLINT